MKRYLNNYKKVWEQSKTLFWRYWLFILIVIFITYLLSYFLHLNPKKTVQSLGDFSGNAANDTGYWQGTIQIFKNNWVACLQIIILSFIPIPFFYTIILLLTSAAIGIVLYLSQLAGLNMFQTIVVGLLPHCLLELSVYIITIYYGSKINQIIIGKLLNKFRRNKKIVQQLRITLKEVISIFILVISPLIFLSAFIEGYITRYLFFN